jgi:hypothetical protein
MVTLSLDTELPWPRFSPEETELPVELDRRGAKSEAAMLSLDPGWPGPAGSPEEPGLRTEPD